MDGGDNSPQTTRSAAVCKLNSEEWMQLRLHIGPIATHRTYTGTEMSAVERLRASCCTHFCITGETGPLSKATFGQQIPPTRSSVGKSTISPSEGALYRQLYHFSRHNQFHSMSICIIQNKCIFVLGPAVDVVLVFTCPMAWFDHILGCAWYFSFGIYDMAS